MWHTALFEAVGRKPSGRGRTVMIVDRDGGNSRLLSFDGAGYKERIFANLSALAGEVLAQRPDMILVQPDAVDMRGGPLAEELNRLNHFHLQYRWREAPGEE